MIEVTITRNGYHNSCWLARLLSPCTTYTIWKEAENLMEILIPLSAQPGPRKWFWHIFSLFLLVLPFKLINVRTKLKVTVFHANRNWILSKNFMHRNSNVWVPGDSSKTCAFQKPSVRIQVKFFSYVSVPFRRQKEHHQIKHEAKETEHMQWW